MARVPKESIEKLSVFQHEVSKLFKFIFDEDKSKETKIEDNVNFPILIDVFEKDNKFIIEAELPGVDKEDIRLNVYKDGIVIKGMKRKETKTKNQSLRYHCMERDFGKFNRVVELGAPINTNEIDAHFKNGILIINALKVPDRRGKFRKVEIV